MSCVDITMNICINNTIYNTTNRMHTHTTNTTNNDTPNHIIMQTIFIISLILL